MGDIADMMLDGTLCEQCSVLMDDHESPGYPRKCDMCRYDGGKLGGSGTKSDGEANDENT